MTSPLVSSERARAAFTLVLKVMPSGVPPDGGRPTPSRTLRTSVTPWSMVPGESLAAMAVHCCRAITSSRRSRSSQYEIAADVAPSEECSKPVPIPSAFDFGLSRGMLGASAGVNSLVAGGADVLLLDDALGDALGSCLRSSSSALSVMTPRTPPAARVATTTVPMRIRRSRAFRALLSNSAITSPASSSRSPTRDRT